MGYTHYIRPTRVLNDEEWRRFTVAVQQILDATEIPIAGWDGTGEPEVNSGLVRFNGRNPDSFETCAIARGEVGFSCCKTARKPYDAVVGAVYWVFQEIHGDLILSSDGDMKGDDWAEARRLAGVLEPALEPAPERTLNPLEQALAEACLSALNLQGSAMRGAVPGLDVDWHFDKIRAALRLIGEDAVDVILRGESE